MYLECNGIQIIFVCFCLFVFGKLLQNYSCLHSTFDFYLDVYYYMIYTNSDNQSKKSLVNYLKSYPLGLYVNYNL